MSLLSSLETRFQARLQAELEARPLLPAPPLTAADLTHLPPPVRRYVLRSGAVGRPRVQRFRIEFDALMWRRPGGAPMRATSLQYNFVDGPIRLFHMRARMLGLPVQALHLYQGDEATFQVRVASLVGVVDERGEVVSRAETVTVLNDMCCFAPGTLVDPRLAWTPLDDRSARVAFTSGRRRIEAVLHFNGQDELADFTSDDREALRDGKLQRFPWSTPVEAYGDVDGLRLPVRAATVYRYPEGDFTYGRFTLRSIAYDAAATPARTGGPRGGAA